MEKIRQFRNDTSIPVFFTMDAGPNVHLLYFEENEKVILDWIKSELFPYCSKTGVLNNSLGKGASKLSG